MIKRLFISLACLLLSASLANACGVAPTYYPNEIGLEPTTIRNIFKDSDRIALGKFIETKNNEKLIFNAEKSFKPSSKIFSNHKMNIQFNDVKNIHYFNRSDTSENQDNRLLETILTTYETQPTLILPANNQASWGGVLSNIHHGADCERASIIHLEQAYLVFLDDDKIIQARFSIDRITSDFLSRLENYLNILKIRTENNPKHFQ